MSIRMHSRVLSTPRLGRLSRNVFKLATFFVECHGDHWFHKRRPQQTEHQLFSCVQENSQCTSRQVSDYDAGSHLHACRLNIQFVPDRPRVLPLTIQMKKKRRNTSDLRLRLRPPVAFYGCNIYFRGIATRGVFIFMKNEHLKLKSPFEWGADTARR